MKKAILLISLVLISSATASAQAGRKGEPARQGRAAEGRKSTSPTGRRLVTLVNGIVRVGPSTTYLRNGLSAGEVLRLLGQPAHTSERREGESLLVSYTFRRAGGRLLVAEFENGVLVSSRTHDGENLARNGEAGQ